MIFIRFLLATSTRVDQAPVVEVPAAPDGFTNRGVAIFHYRDDGFLHLDLDLRLQARALVLTLEPKLTSAQVADALVDMAGATPAAPIAARRALARLESANTHRPSERTGRAIEALGIALARVQERRRFALLPPTDKDVSVGHARGDGNP